MTVMVNLYSEGVLAKNIYTVYSTTIAIINLLEIIIYFSFYYFGN